MTQALDALDAGYKAAFEAALKSFAIGCYPIGAGVIDQAGNIVSTGGNRIGARDEGDGLLRGSKIAHAEINALAALSLSEHPNAKGYSIYTTVEPCPLCAGGIAMSGIKTLHFAARDVTAGASSLLQMHPFTRAKQIKVQGPAPGLEEISLCLLILWCLDQGRGALAREYSAFSPEAGAAARELFSANRLNELKKLPLEETFSLLDQKIQAKEETQ